MNTNHAPAAQPFVSVVTPFYNTAQYLAECIESVLRQNYDNWEYILLDNCSTDGSTKIAKQYAAQDSRIRLVRNNILLPQVQNYNAALSLISPQSSYCKMVQADDWIYPECIARMVTLAESDPSIGIVSSYSLWGDRVFCDGLPYTTTVIPGAKLCRLQLMTSRFFFGSPTTVLYRSEIIRDASPFFNPSAVHDDTNACYRTLRMWKFGFVHQVLSFSRAQESSIMSRARDFGPALLDELLQLYEFGPLYLGLNELAGRLKACKDSYYRFLGRRFLAGSSKPFWQYQVSGLRSGGHQIEYGQLFKHICLELLRLLANPGSTAALLFDRIRAKTGTRNSQRALRDPGIGLSPRVPTPHDPR